MTGGALLAALWRTLRRGLPAPAPGPGSGALSFEPDWAGLLVQLGLPARALRAVVESGSLHPHLHYQHYRKPKKGGGWRDITEPDSALKRIQHQIIARYFASEQPHPAAVAYQKGKSTADHVWAHAGAEVLVTADVRDFFPSTRAGRVEDWWLERVDTDTARLLTLLTTYRGGLPQGAPTSPGLSNFVNRELDERLARRAEAAGARYTRYCDDLAFSWRAGWGPPSEFERGVRATLHEFGYELHPEKGWCVYSRLAEPEITGVILTRRGGVRLPERLQRVMRTLAGSKDALDAQRLEGYRGYSAMVARRPGRRRARKK
ncbi:MAG: reverse transcriptase family protein [Gemmataceae bacterium]|nr:reverse transcriptase family protein [Gemmataceae bacterium]